MGVSFTYSPDFGVKITVGLPKHVGREAGFEICDAIDALVREQLERKEEGRRAAMASRPEPTEEALPCPAGTEPKPAQTALEYVPFPIEGTVTMKEITAAWKISQATYYRHLDIYPNPLKPEGLAKNATARFDAAAVARAFECGHVERRRREVRV
ncbi:hypothetical protein [Synergistes jonesii]|uniref:Uncharacterized protein n=1 Tax=Synergistes jonesii TaxID=2754 RepID=A0A073J6J8_9BACT|nr:hypothetical protein [Synergistes jonesii]KEJ93352.1 hypothetical protein EH55_08605 [Synergistes jonesii]OFB65107.1 hypothetical protein JS73_01110 [Synergistes jonesii]OFB65946.1 hypothetical protein JS72_00380 [Synergistes jonesii]OFB66380.1 hypothetical protein JS79_01120 [Synergistes jonesii]OFB69095.1 hypothetical protein JS78_01120 [Synergistes jonesii]